MKIEIKVRSHSEKAIRRGMARVAISEWRTEEFVAPIRRERRRNKSRRQEGCEECGIDLAVEALSA